MKKLLLIATGGTIASKNKNNGLTPQITPKEMLSFVPRACACHEISAVSLFSLDSTNITSDNWRKIAECIQANYDNFDGFIVTHGTDTMAYTAAALSYMIKNPGKPIVITGSQRPIDLDVTDARTNLNDAITVAASDFCGVLLVFDGKIIAGTRAKKTRSKSYNAFSSMDFPVLGIVMDFKITRYIPTPKPALPVEFALNMNDNIFLLKLTPGMDAKILPFVFEHYDAIIVESFGMGGIPASIKSLFLTSASNHPEVLVVMATQVAHEGSDMTIYEVGKEIRDHMNLLESGDMPLEAVITKTMWILSNCATDFESRSRAFYTPVNFDLITSEEK